MIKGKFIIFMLFVVILAYTGCERTTDPLDPEILGYNYTPLAVGKQWIYKTDSIFFTKTNIILRDTVSNYTLVKVVDTVINVFGEKEYALDFFKSDAPEGPWFFVDNAFITTNKSMMIKTEFGLDFIAFTYPVKKFVRWNGVSRFSNKNSILIRGEFYEPFSYWTGDTYFYKNIFSKDVIDAKSYDDVVHLEEVNYEDALNKIYSESRYARNIGLIYREFWLLKTQIDDMSMPWDTKAERGLILTQKLHSYN